MTQILLPIGRMIGGSVDKLHPRVEKDGKTPKLDRDGKPMMQINFRRRHAEAAGAYTLVANGVGRADRRYWPIGLPTDVAKPCLLMEDPRR